MPKIILDLATKVIREEDKIWAIFPGRGKRFLDQFIEQQSIFLETPGIALRPGVLADEKLLRQHVAMSMAIEAYAIGAAPAPPPRRAGAYEIPHNAQFSDTFGCVRNMFIRMKPADLILMAGKSLYRPIYAGEIITPFSPDDVTQVPAYGREDVPFRRVKWLDVRKERRFLSERLSRTMSNRHAVVSIDKIEHGEQAYTVAYGDFVYGDESRYVFDGPAYKNIPSTTVPGIELLSYFVAATAAYDKGELDKFKGLDISAAISAYASQEALYSFEIDFASAGKYVIHAKNAAKALVIALLVAATGDNISYADARSAVLTNSHSHHIHGMADDACPVPIWNEFKDIMESVGAQRHNELCQKNKAAKSGVGLRVGVKVIKQ